MTADLAARRRYLIDSQNPDGGWGYFRGKKSWLEPTAYTMLALMDGPAHDAAAAGAAPCSPGESPTSPPRRCALEGDAAAAAVEKAWSAVRSWQSPDGGWRPGAGVDQPGWGTALAVTLHCVRGVADRAFDRGVEWLIRVKGDEGALWKRIINKLQPGAVQHDASVQGWPWLPKNTSWVEPTAHALIALKKSLGPMRARKWPGVKAIEWRVGMAERMLADRRCADGGWNYGNKLVQDVKLPSYPETTALALVGLQGSTASLGGTLELARSLREKSRSRLARAWLAVALRNHGVDVAGGDAPPSNDILVTALEALSAPDGNYRLLGTVAS